MHLTPRRLAFTVVKSGFVVAAPMINQVILENLDEVCTVCMDMFLLLFSSEGFPGSL